MKPYVSPLFKITLGVVAAKGGGGRLWWLRGAFGVTFAKPRRKNGHANPSNPIFPECWPMKCQKKSKTIEREKKKLVLSDFPAVCDGENVSAECPKEGKTLKEGKGGGLRGQDQRALLR